MNHREAIKLIAGAAAVAGAAPTAMAEIPLAVHPLDLPELMRRTAYTYPPIKYGRMRQLGTYERVPS